MDAPCVIGELQVFPYTPGGEQMEQGSGLSLFTSLVHVSSVGRSLGKKDPGLLLALPETEDSTSWERASVLVCRHILSRVTLHTSSKSSSAPECAVRDRDAPMAVQVGPGRPR